MKTQPKLTWLYKTSINPVLIILIFSSFAHPLTSLAQKTHIHQTQLWYGYFNTLKFSDDYRLITDVQERQFIEPVGAQGNFILRTILYKNLGNNWEIGLGPALFFNSPQKIPSPTSTAVPEIRPTFDILNKQKTGKLNIGHRYRVEARFHHDVADGKLVSGYTFGNFRFRYQISADYPIIRNAEKKTVLAAKVYDEIHLNVGKKIVSNTFDQNRIYGGFTYNVSNAFAVDLGYLFWFQETSDGRSYYDRNIFRLAINHRIDLSKSSK
jgi:hypothetical protein